MMRRKCVLGVSALLSVAVMTVTVTCASAAQAGPGADQLREAASCAEQISAGEFSEDAGGERTIAVCSTGPAVHWKSDFDIDCDGQRTDECNEETDPSFLPETAWQQSDGQPLDSARLPYVVVPSVNATWDFRGAGIDGGTVAAVVHGDKVAYAVVGDIGPENMIGEGSYRLAEQLGIDPDPATGGVSGAVVDFILFPGVSVDVIEDNAAAITAGEAAASAFVGG